jgi:competence protein CoiA
VIEIQRSSIGIRQLLARTADYTAMGIAILWIVPLTEDLGTDLFRPRFIERYLHSLYFGRVYYWMPGMGAKVLPTHFSPAVRAVPYRTNEGGYWEDAGFINKPYKLIRRPRYFRDTIPIGEAFHQESRVEFLPWGGTQPIPKANIWMDSVPMWWPLDERKSLYQSYPDVEGADD